jgi:hypothetical protein
MQNDAGSLRVRYGAMSSRAIVSRVPGWRERLLAPCLPGLLLLGACHGHACPASGAPGDAARWSAELRRREPLALSYGSDISVKRDVRDVLVDVEASRFAAAFAQVMTDPERRFGLIRIDRLPEHVGNPFVVGEKFQGRYGVEGAITEQLRGKARAWFGELADSDHVQDWLCAVENQHTSNFGEIRRIELSSVPGTDSVLEYVYLDGSPIAGSSTFTVSEVTDPALLGRYGVAQAARMQQVFEYQERGASFAGFFTRGGLRLHNQVVYSQAEQSAAAAGGRVLDSNIPVEYRSW